MTDLPTAGGSSGGSNGSCPPGDDLCALVDVEMEGERALQVDAHASECDRCRDLRARLIAVRLAVGELGDPAPAGAAERAVAAALAAADAAESAGEPVSPVPLEDVRRARDRRRLRMLSAAAAVLLLFGVAKGVDYLVTSSPASSTAANSAGILAPLRASGAAAGSAVGLHAIRADGDPGALVGSIAPSRGVHVSVTRKGGSYVVGIITSPSSAAPFGASASAGSGPYDVVVNGAVIGRAEIQQNGSLVVTGMTKSGAASLRRDLVG
ncbi:MAG: hypothetical protein ACRD0Z_14150 [Acidimicrobiales bacterium]